MSRAQRFEFEGEMLTVTEIRKRVPALPDATIRNHLAAGRNTREQMLNFSAGAANVKNGKAQAKRNPLRFGARR